MESPVGTLAGSCGMPGNLDEAVVEAEIVSEGVLPTGGVVLVVGKVVHDELVDFGERKHFLSGMVDRHRCQGDVRVWRLAVTIAFT